MLIKNEQVKRNILWKADIIETKRVETPEIPLKALREIICNSFAHAKYNSMTEHEITIHPTMLRIYNPGEFPIGYKPEDFVNENISSMVRNPIILKTLFLSEDVESYSSGFKRVYDECGKKDVKIDYVINREGFTFIFKRNVVNSVVNNELTNDERMIVEILKNNPNYTAAKLATLINKNSRSVQRILSELKRKEIIERVGGTRGYWKVII